MLSWVNKMRVPLLEYDAPDDCVPNDDGSVFHQHALEEHEWLEVMQLVSLHGHFLTDLMVGDLMVMSCGYAGGSSSAHVAIPRNNGRDEKSLHIFGVAHDPSNC